MLRAMNLGKRDERDGKGRREMRRKEREKEENKTAEGKRGTEEKEG